MERGGDREQWEKISFHGLNLLFLVGSVDALRHGDWRA
jgi:hypothetical protein